MSEQSTSGDPIAAFGPNEWLVEELYHRYLTDKNSVDRAWWEFFKDYGTDGGRAGNGSAPTLPPVAPGVTKPANGAAPRVLRRSSPRPPPPRRSGRHPR